ncbi:hypothetical protein BC829DRAFT_421501 [Chytridium lagenaria]|nr:hypothetical protein BC829DRAFT_421501 [Chytridium lagenaria]
MAPTTTSTAASRGRMERVPLGVSTTTRGDDEETVDGGVEWRGRREGVEGEVDLFQVDGEEMSADFEFKGVHVVSTSDAIETGSCVGVEADAVFREEGWEGFWVHEMLEVAVTLWWNQVVLRRQEKPKKVSLKVRTVRMVEGVDGGAQMEKLVRKEVSVGIMVLKALGGQSVEERMKGVDDGLPQSTVDFAKIWVY